MKTGILIISVFLSGTILYFSAPGISAEKRPLWSNERASCHDGKTPPAAELLVKKHKTVDEFTAGV